MGRNTNNLAKKMLPKTYKVTRTDKNGTSVYSKSYQYQPNPNEWFGAALDDFSEWLDNKLVKHALSRNEQLEQENERLRAEISKVKNSNKD